MTHLARFIPSFTLLAAIAACDESGRAPPDTGVLADASDAADSASPDTSDTSDTSDTVDARDTADPDTDPLDTGHDTSHDTDPLDTSHDTSHDTTLDDTGHDTSPDVAADAPDTAPADQDTTPDACQRFSISPAKAYLEPFGFTFFVATGALGEPRFSLPTDTTGASIHPTLGTFLAGPTSGTVIVRVTDPICGARDAEVTVVEPLRLLPRDAAIEPDSSLTLVVAGGSGQVELTLTTPDGRTPLASLSSDGTLTAASPEELIVRAHDRATGATSASTIHVRAGAALALSPPDLTVPLGESYRLQVSGGSGVIDASLPPGAMTTPDGDPAPAPVLALADGVVTALTPGRAHLTVTDRYTRATVTGVVDVVAAPALPMNPAGDTKLQGQLLVTDLDGDDLPEAIIAVPEADVGAYDSGVVLVHRGVDDGFDPEPSLTLTTTGRVDELGTAIAIADLDGDGLPDLVVGAPLAEGLGTDRGVVFIHRGHPETFFEETPSGVLVGEANSDLYGSALAACDLNGDGRIDLAIAARQAEDENQSPVAANAGGIYVHLGYASGFSQTPDQVFWGALPDGPTLVPRANLNLGRAMASGDVDGDGRCDLLVSALAFSAGAGRTNDGLFMVLAGRGPDDFGPGGIEPTPRLVVVGDDLDAGSQLGLSVAMGDVDGDGLDDLLVGQPEYNRRVGAASRASNGAAILWPGASVPTEPATGLTSVTTAPWRYVGRDNVNEVGDRVGYAVAIGDLDGIPPLDLFIAARIDEQAPHCAANCGTVHALTAVGGALPSPLAPTLVYSGDRADQNFGALIAVTPDFDGDGLAELLVRAATDSRIAPRLGVHVLRASTATTPPTLLDFPYASAGSRNGAALAALPDLDGDGLPELAVGAWRSQFDPASTAPHRPGEVALYRGAASGVAPTPFQRLGGFPGQATGDIFGHALGVTDADGDTRPELAVVVRLDDTGNACAPAKNDVGSVMLFEADAAGGLLAAPMATLFGPQASQQVHAVVGVDLDGDGRGDVVLAGTLWDLPGLDNVGGLGVFWGRVDLAGNRCAPDVTVFGAAAGDALGTALESLGDLNRDGCEDVVAGAPNADPPGAPNAGAAIILWGFGPRCAFASPSRSVVSPLVAAATAGVSLAAADLDGDGLKELAIGSRVFSNGVEAVGAVWLASGRHLAALAATAEPWLEGPLTRASLTAPLGQPPIRLVGTRRNEDFAAALALLPGLAGEDGWLVVGRPLSDLPGVDGAGAVSVHGVRIEGQAFAITAPPTLVVGGETRRPRADFGRTLTAWRSPGGRIVGVGAALSSALGLDDGAVFATRPR